MLKAIVGCRTYRDHVANYMLSRLSCLSPDPVKQRHVAASITPMTSHSELRLKSHVHPEHRSSSDPQRRTWDTLGRRILA
jgi:hypothetical protein